MCAERAVLETLTLQQAHTCLDHALASKLVRGRGRNGRFLDQCTLALRVRRVLDPHLRLLELQNSLWHGAYTLFRLLNPDARRATNPRVRRQTADARSIEHLPTNVRQSAMMRLRHSQ